MDQPPTESPAPKKLGSGYIAGAAIMALVSGFISMPRSRDSGTTTAYVIGTFFGGVVGFALAWLLVYGLVRLLAKKKPPSTAAKVAFWVLFAMLFLRFANFLGRAVNPRTALAQAAFTTEDRTGLKVAADSIRHPGLAFTLPHPGKTFVASPETEKLLADQFGGQVPPDLVNWAFRDTTRQQMLLIQLIKMPGLNEEKFREAARGMEKGLARAKLLSHSLVWDPAKRELRSTAQHPNGLYLITRCLPSVKPRVEYFICVQIYSEEQTGLAAVSNGLTLTK